MLRSRSRSRELPSDPTSAQVTASGMRLSRRLGCHEQCNLEHPGAGYHLSPRCIAAGHGGLRQQCAARTRQAVIDIVKATPIATAAITAIGGLAGLGIYYGLRAYRHGELRRTAQPDSIFHRLRRKSAGAHGGSHVWQQRSGEGTERLAHPPQTDINAACRSTIGAVAGLLEPGSRGGSWHAVRYFPRSNGRITRRRSRRPPAEGSPWQGPVAGRVPGCPDRAARSNRPWTTRRGAAEIVATTSLSAIRTHSGCRPPRRGGYAVCADEMLINDVSVAAPVLDSSGHPMAAVNTAVSKTRFTVAAAERRFAPRVLATAQAKSG